MARKGAKTMETTTGNGQVETAIVPTNGNAMVLDDRIVSAYLEAGFKASEAEGYERDIAEIHNAMRDTTLGFVKVGEVWTRIKERVGHGSLTFLMSRAGVADRTMQNAMAAYRAFTKYPILAERVDSIASTTLAYIGSRSDVTEAAVTDIAVEADHGEATQERVLQIIKDHAPAKAPKTPKVKSFFANMPLDRAAEYQERAIPFLSQAAGAMATSGANLPGLLKSPTFKGWLKDLGKSDLSSLPDFDRALLGFLAASFMWTHPTQ